MASKLDIQKWCVEFARSLMRYQWFQRRFWLQCLVTLVISLLVLWTVILTFSGLSLSPSNHLWCLALSCDFLRLSANILIFQQETDTCFKVLPCDRHSVPRFTMCSNMLPNMARHFRNCFRMELYYIW
jgi:hypothetical protein